MFKKNTPPHPSSPVPPFPVVMQAAVEVDAIVPVAAAKSPSRPKQAMRKVGRVVDKTVPVAVQGGLAVVQVAGAVGGAAADVFAGPGGGAGVSAAVGLVATVCDIGMAIYEQFKLAYANKAQCKRLAERVQIICESVRGLDVTRNVSHYIAALQKLESTLRSCLELIQKFSDRSWFKRVINAGTDSEQFESFYTDLSTHIQQLQLGINTQSLLNEEEARKDAEFDRAAMLANQGQILQLNYEMRQTLYYQGFQAEERNRILQMQMDSITEQLQQLLNGQSSSHQLSSSSSASLSDENALPSYLKVPFHQLVMQEKLGEGSLGAVYLGFWREQEVAIKMISGDFTELQKREFIREVKITNRLRSPHIIQLFGACIEPGRACMVLEYLPGGALDKYLRHHELTLPHREQLVLQIAQGLYYLHDNSLLHRDLKGSSILVDELGRAKIGNLGLAKAEWASIQTIGDAKQSQSFAWMAPEVLGRGGTYTAASDVYSFGLLMWMIFTGETPYAGLKEQQIPQCVISGQRESFTTAIPDSYQNLIARCWAQDPHQRPTMEEVLQVLRPLQPKLLESQCWHSGKRLDAEALYEKGMTLINQGDYTQASACFWKSASKGHLKAQTNLGTLCLQNQLPVSAVTQEQMPKQVGHAYLLSSAKGGHVRAMTNVAYQFESGDGIEKNIKEAAFWYQKAGDQGDKAAQARSQQLFATLNK